MKSESINLIPVEIAQYEQLRRLWIYGVLKRPSQRIIWKPAHYHNLSELQLHYLEIEPTATSAFWDLCTQLKIEEVTVDEMPVRSTTFDRLQHLKLWLKSQNPIERQLDWITRCPNLASLDWWYSSEGRPTSQFMGHFVPGNWPHLSELVLDEIEFTDTQLAQVIEAMQDLKSLTVRQCEVGSCFLDALRHHSQTLTTLSTTFCEVSMTSLVPEIMASFPYLESLYAEAVMSQGFIDGPPWVCENSLKALGIEISFSLNQGADYQ
jgi:hypothetical protein